MDQDGPTQGQDNANIRQRSRSRIRKPAVVAPEEAARPPRLSDGKPVKKPAQSTATPSTANMEPAHQELQPRPAIPATTSPVALSSATPTVAAQPRETENHPRRHTVLASAPVPVIHPVTLASQYHPATLPSVPIYQHAATLANAYQQSVALAISSPHTTYPATLPASTSHHHYQPMSLAAQLPSSTPYYYYGPPQTTAITPHAPRYVPATNTSPITPASAPPAYHQPQAAPMDLDGQNQNTVYTDMAVAEELKRTGAISHELFQHMTTFLRQKIQTQPSQPATRRARAPEAAEPTEVKRRCQAPAPPPNPRDPRARNNEGHSFAEAARQATRTTTATATPIAVASTTATNASTSASPNASTSASTSAAVKPRYPPLIVETLPNWAFHLRTIREKLGHAPSARAYGKGVRFTPTTDNEYRTIQRYLTELEKTERISWFSYSLPADKAIKVALRGLPLDTTPEEATAALTELGFKVEYMKQIRTKLGRAGCLFYCIVANGPGVAPRLYEITELLCLPGIHIEAWRGKKGPAQCHRCQGFRHSSHHCHRPLACVRCSEEHFSKECPRPRE